MNSALIARLRDSPMPPAVVVGTDVTGLTMARALAAHGVPVLGVDALRRRYTGHSGAFHLLLCPDDFLEPSFVGWLADLADGLPQRAALFLSMDQHVSVIGSLGQHLRNRYHFAFPDSDSVELLMNKQRFTRHAIDRGWPVPRSVLAASADELDANASELTFPVILKPSVKTSEFRRRSPAKAFRCGSLSELRSAYGAMASWEREVVVQEWIPGDDGEVYFSFHSLRTDLSEIASFEGRKIRQWAPECGSTSSCIGVARPQVTELSRLILRETRCIGLGAVEYKRDPRTDRFYITEPTVGRANLQVGVAIANGVNIVARTYFDLIGRPYPPSPPPTHDRKWILLRSDARSAAFYVRRGDLTWAGWLRSLRGPKQFAVYRLADLPLLGHAMADFMLGKPMRLARRILRALTKGRAHR